MQFRVREPFSARRFRFLLGHVVCPAKGGMPARHRPVRCSLTTECAPAVTFSHSRAVDPPRHGSIAHREISGSTLRLRSRSHLAGIDRPTAPRVGRPGRGLVTEASGERERSSGRQQGRESRDNVFLRGRGGRPRTLFAGSRDGKAATTFSFEAEAGGRGRFPLAAGTGKLRQRFPSRQRRAGRGRFPLAAGTGKLRQRFPLRVSQERGRFPSRDRRADLLVGFPGFWYCVASTSGCRPRLDETARSARAHQSR